MVGTVWPFIVLTYVSIFCLGFLDNSRGPLFSEILRVFNLTDGQGAWFFTMASMFSFVGAISSLYIVNKTNRIQGMRISLLLLSLGGFIISLAPNIYILLLGAAILGISFGLMGAQQNVLVSIGASSSRRQQFVTGMHAMYGLASLLAPLLVAAIMKFFGEWRMVFTVVSVFPLLAIIYTFFIPKELFHHADKNPLEKKVKAKVWSFEKLLLASVMGIYTTVELLVATRLSLYLQRKYGFTLEQSSLHLSYFYLFFLFSRIVFSVKKFAFPIQKQFFVLLILSCITLSLGIAFEPWLLILSALFLAPCFPLFITYISEEYHHDLDSMMLIVFSLQAALVVSMHMCVGYLSDIIGLNRVIWMGPILLIISMSLFIIYSNYVRLLKVKVK